MGFDAILTTNTMEVILNDTRENCLKWMRQNRELSESVYVSAHDRNDFISGTQYLVTYG